MVSGAEQSPAEWRYCINPHCQQRLNPRANQTCQSCGTELLIAGRYRLLEPLRQLHPGYITEIFAVEDEQDHAPKVLKVLTRHHSKLIELFKREAEVLHRLDSPGIPKVDDVGCFTVTVCDRIALPLDNRPKPLHCLVMERIEGQDLQHWLKENGAISQTLALVWLQQLAEILDQIHSNNLFHRDIKPSNIMLRPAGAWGQLVLIDFGTAREVTETVVKGHDSTVVYSDGYTAPEQIRGRAIPQSDFFALGRTFIHLLTNLHPNEFPEEPDTQNLVWRDRAPHIAPYLADLISRMAADSVRDRPISSRDLLNQLQSVQAALFPRPLFLSSSEVFEEAFGSQTILPLGDEWITQVDGTEQATRLQDATALERRDLAHAPATGSWLRRYQEGARRFVRGRSGKRLLLGALLATLVLVNIGALMWRRSQNLRQQIVQTQDLLAQAVSLQGVSGAQVEDSLLLGVAAWRQLKALGLSTLPAEQVLQRGLSHLPRATLRITHGDDVNAAVFSADGRLIATAGADNTAQVWNGQTRELVAELTHKGPVRAIALSPNGETIATGSADQTVRIAQLSDPDTVRTLATPTSVQALAFSPDGQVLAGASGATVILWQASTGEVVRQITHPGFVTDFAFSPNGEWLAIAGNDGSVDLYQPLSPNAAAQRLTHPSSVNAIAFSPDSTQLLTGSQDQVARLWSIAQRTVVRQLQHDRSVVAVAFSPLGTHLATGTGSPLPLRQSHSVQLWETQTGRLLFQASHDASVTDLAFSPDGQRLASASFDQTAMVWDVPSGEPVAQMTHDDAILRVGFSPNGRSLVTSSLDNTAQVWELVGNPVLLMLEHPATVREMAFSPDGSQLVTSSADQTLRLWNTSTGERITQFTADQPVGAIAFNPAMQSFATLLAERTVQLWNLNTGSPTVTFSHPERINAIAFSPDGRYLATASADNTARVWETNSGLEVARLEHDSFVEAVSFSPDGRYLATAGLDNTARLWEWQGTSPREVNRFSHESFVSAVSFSPNGRYLATASLDNTVRLWDLETSAMPEVARLVHANDVIALSFSGDGDYLVTTSTAEGSPAGGDGNVVQVWSVPDGRSVFSITDPVAVHTAGFTPDGRFLATSSPTEGVQAWSIPEGQEVARLSQSPTGQPIVFAPSGQAIATNSGLHLILWTWQGRDLVQQTCDRLTRPLSREAWQRYFGNRPYRPICGERG